MIIGYSVPSNPIKLLKGPYPLLEMEELMNRGHQVIPIPYNFEDAYISLIKRCDFLLVHRVYNGERMKRLGIPYGVVFHGPDKEKMGVLRRLDRIPECKWIGYITEYNKYLLQKWSIKKKLVSTPNVVRVDLFNRTKPLGNKIICGSRFIPAKQFELVLESFPDAWVYGDGVDDRYKNFLYNTFTKANFTGWLSGEQIKELYDDGWIYISPSIHEGEGAPKTVMEAMLMELQILVTPKGGTKEFKGVNFLSDNPTSNDIKTMTNNISKERNVEGRDWVLKHHHPKVFVDNIIKAIEEVI